MPETATMKKARPTEFEGMVYRSKSEAMFACALAATGAVFEYEPTWLEIGELEYTPDFLIARNQQKPNGHRHRYVTFILIEYKPSMPTATYLGELSGNMERCLKESRLFPPAVHLAVAIGSPWNARAALLWDHDAGEWLEWGPEWWAFGIEAEHVEIARNYRYDLQ